MTRPGSSLFDLTDGPRLEIADRARQLLADGLTPQEIVARLTPQTKPEALAIARRLPLLAERTQDRGAALARLAARIGMKRFRLFFTPDGRVADDPAYNRPAAHPDSRQLPAVGYTVIYTARYFPDKDHFQFTGPEAGEPDQWGVVPRQPIPFSGTGYWSHFADPDAVAALGGPEAYLAALTAAGRDGLAEFERGFAGQEPEQVRKSRKPVVGKHTARAVEQPEPERTDDPPGGQRSLFQ